MLCVAIDCSDDEHADDANDAKTPGVTAKHRLVCNVASGMHRAEGQKREGECIDVASRSVRHLGNHDPSEE